MEKKPKNKEEQKPIKNASPGADSIELSMSELQNMAPTQTPAPTLSMQPIFQSTTPAHTRACAPESMQPIFQSTSHAQMTAPSPTVEPITFQGTAPAQMTSWSRVRLHEEANSQKKTIGERIPGTPRGESSNQMFTIERHNQVHQTDNTKHALVQRIAQITIQEDDEEAIHSSSERTKEN